MGADRPAPRRLPDPRKEPNDESIVVDTTRNGGTRQSNMCSSGTIGERIKQGNTTRSNGVSYQVAPYVLAEDTKAV